VPSDRLFYSGGGGSVRGYSYQGVGPRLPDNTPRGGISLFETSVEVRHRLRGALGIAAFVDAGAVGFQEYPDFEDVRFGAGIGVRYDLPFGPIRADVAFPLDRRDGDASFQIYVSIGQAF
jgi:translocation and assembly module TamA